MTDDDLDPEPFMAAQWEVMGELYCLSSITMDGVTRSCDGARDHPGAHMSMDGVSWIRFEAGVTREDEA